MRLKGGKLLLDLTDRDIVNDIEYQLTDEQYNAIIEKGLCVKIKNPHNVVSIVDLVVHNLLLDIISFQPMRINVGEEDTQYSAHIVVSQKILVIAQS